LTVYKNMQRWEGLMDSPDSIINRQIKHKLALSIVDRIYVDGKGNLSIQYRVGSQYSNNVIEIFKCSQNKCFK